MHRVAFLFVSLCAFGVARAQLLAPQNLQAFTEYDGAIIQFDPVEGAAGYLGVLEADSVESSDPQLYFGDLSPLTEYTVIVSAVDEDGEPGEPNLLVFTTGVGKINNFHVVTTSASLMTLEWDPMSGVERYIIDPKEDKSRPPIQLVNTSSTLDLPTIPSVRMTGDASATLSGLRPMSYYIVNIRGVRGVDLGPVTTIKVRTDGEGLVLYNIWKNHDDEPLGGSGMIFKPLQRPKGPYQLTVTFPCPFENFEVWNAVILNTSSAETGVYVLLQDDVWMQEKNEVGFNFHTVYNQTNYEINCTFDLKNIKVEYDTPPEMDEFTEEFDVPIDVDDWGGGGIMYVKIEEIFRGPNQAADEEEARIRRVKPDRAKLGLRLVPGENCSSITLVDCWNIDRVYNSSVDTADNGYFFIQHRDQWYTNDIGIMFQYDEAVCPDRTAWIVSVLVGGDLVRALQQSYNLQDDELKGTCADSYVI